MSSEEIVDKVDRDELRELKKRPFINEPFWIALLIIVPFVGITLWLIYLNNIDAFKEIASVWGVWVGAVLGYYFGSRPMEALAKRVNSFMDTVDDSSEDYERQLDEADDTIDDLQAKYDKAIKDIQYIVLKYPTALDKELTERLKTDYEVSL